MMKMPGINYTALLGILAIGVSLTAPMAALAQSEKTAAAQHLNIGISQYPSTLHPLFDAMVAKSLIMGAAQRPMTAHNAAWEAECLICTELPSFENGLAVREKFADGKTGIAATYKIKPGLMWDDGTPLTAADFIFAWHVGKHPQSGVSNGEFFSKDIRDISSSASDTLTIHFDKEKCNFAPINDFHPLPAHLEKAIFEQDPANYKSRTLYNTDPTRKGLYFGPYRISRLQTGAFVTLEKNPHWHGTPPGIDFITYKTIESSAALTAHLLSSAIDYIAGELGLTLDQALAFEKRLKTQRPGQYNVVYKQGLTYEHIDLPLDRAPFDDLRLRRALMYGMNRGQINTVVFEGRQPPALSNINPLDTVFTADVTTYAFDPAKAALLLDEAGWKKGADGYRYNAKGERLSITLSTTAGNKSREVIQQSIQSDWKKIGIDTVIKNEPARVLFGSTMRERQFSGGVMYAWLSSPANIPKTTLHSAMIPSPENNFAGQNYPAYKNPEADRILDALDITCAPAENTALWHELQKLYAQELPALPLYYRAEAFFIPTWLHGITPTGHLHPTTLWIENWSIRK